MRSIINLTYSAVLAFSMALPGVAFADCGACKGKEKHDCAACAEHGGKKCEHKKGKKCTKCHEKKADVEAETETAE